MGGVPRSVTAPGRTGVAAALAGVWLATVAGFAVTRAATGDPDPSRLASTPAGVAAGRAWTLVTSGLVIDGRPVPQLVGAALVVGGVVRGLGGPTFWRVAAAGHVGATLIAYAGIGVLWLGRPADVAGVVHRPDYGISAVWAAALGALLVAGVARSGRHRHAYLVASVVFATGFVALVPLEGELADFEHLLAFVLGVAVAELRVRATHTRH